MRKAIFFLVIACLAGGGYLLRDRIPEQYLDTIKKLGMPQDKVAQAAPPQVRPVPIEAVRPAPETSFREFPATIQAARRVDLSFPVSGVLVELNGQAGRRVKMDEVIARLDPRDFQNAVNSARASHDEARLNLERTRTLRSQGVTTQSELDSAKAAFEMAEAKLRIESKALEDTVIRAPFDGVVARRYVENHEYVKNDTSVLSVKSLDELEVTFHVPERVLARWGNTALQGAQVSFETGDDKWLDADIHEVSAEADAVTRTYEVVAAVKAPENLLLLSGMTAKARLLLPTGLDQKNAVLAPMASVFGGSDGGSYVWVIDKDGGAPKRTSVQLGGMRQDGVVVLSGLEEGQLVAVAGVNSLRPDMKVRPMHSANGGLD